MKLWWNKLVLKWKYKRYLAVRKAYNCGDVLFFASRPDMEVEWKQLIARRTYVIDLIKKKENTDGQETNTA